MEQLKSVSTEKITHNDFWNEYKAKNTKTTLDKKTFFLILELFFSKIAIRILNGYVFHMGEALGKIYIKKKIRRPAMDSNGTIYPKINMGLTRINKLSATKEEIDNKSYIVYRTNLSFHHFAWESTLRDRDTGTFLHGRTAYYKFKAARDVERRITEFYPEDRLC